MKIWSVGWAWLGALYYEMPSLINSSLFSYYECRIFAQLSLSVTVTLLPFPVNMPRTSFVRATYNLSGCVEMVWFPFCLHFVFGFWCKWLLYNSGIHVYSHHRLLGFWKYITAKQNSKLTLSYLPVTLLCLNLARGIWEISSSGTLESLRLKSDKTKP